MIENEDEFKKYLKYERKLTDGSINNYLTYIREVPKQLSINISPKNINEQKVEGIITLLKEKGIDWGNTQSALRAYSDYSKIYHSNNLFPDQISEFIEGSVTQVYVNIYERDRKARDACIAYHQAICKACSFDFSKKYGNELGGGFIHVHHIKPLHTIGKEYQVDPINDLVPVCPNCHAMLHKTNPPLTIEQLKRKICE